MILLCACRACSISLILVLIRVATAGAAYACGETLIIIWNHLVKPLQPVNHRHSDGIHGDPWQLVEKPDGQAPQMTTCLWLCTCCGMSGPRGESSQQAPYSVV